MLCSIGKKSQVICNVTALQMGRVEIDLGEEDEDDQGERKVPAEELVIFCLLTGCRTPLVRVMPCFGSSVGVTLSIPGYLEKYKSIEQ